MAKRILAACAAAVLTLTASGGVKSVNPEFLKWRQEKNRAVKTEKPGNAAVSKRFAKTKELGETGEEATAELGYVPSVFDRAYLANVNSSQPRGVRGVKPERFDLRDGNLLTYVKDQNPYGTCWAHAAVASLESFLLSDEKRDFDFSENNMANLHGFDWAFDEGGNGDMAAAYLLRWAGPVLEEDDPYGRPGKSVCLAPVRHVQNIRWIPKRTFSLDLDNIKDALVRYGAVYATYWHSSACYRAATAAY